LVLYEANRHDYILLKYKEIKPDTTDKRLFYLDSM